MSARLFVLCLLFLLIATLSGCGPTGPKKVEVSGTVTFDGEPVKKGDINFVPEDSSQGPEGGTIVDGKYRMQAKTGKNRVEIRAVRDSGKKDPMGTGGNLMEDYIPAKYSGQKSVLSADVGEGKTEHNFKLEK
jgi:hypothetical protein